MLKALNFFPKTCSFFTFPFNRTNVSLSFNDQNYKSQNLHSNICGQLSIFVDYCEINTTGLLILTKPRRASTSAWRTDRSHPFYPGLQASPTGLRLRMGLTSDLTSGTALCLCTTMTRAATRVRKSAFVLPVLWPSISR